MSRERYYAREDYRWRFPASIRKGFTPEGEQRVTFVLSTKIMPDGDCECERDDGMWRIDDMDAHLFEGHCPSMGTPFSDQVTITMDAKDLEAPCTLAIATGVPFEAPMDLEKVATIDYTQTTDDSDLDIWVSVLPALKDFLGTTNGVEKTPAFREAFQTLQRAVACYHGAKGTNGKSIGVKASRDKAKTAALINEKTMPPILKAEEALRKTLATTLLTERPKEVLREPQYKKEWERWVSAALAPLCHALRVHMVKEEVLPSKENPHVARRRKK